MTTTTTTNDHRLPPEVLRRILLLGKLPEFPNYSWTKYAPFFVCSYWREIALDTGELFTKVLFDKESITGVTSKDIEKLKEWLVLSKNHGLSIVLRIPDDPSLEPRWRAIFAPLFAHTRRWQSLSITASAVPLIHAIRMLDRASQLESLSITQLSGWGPLYHFQDKNHPTRVPTMCLPNLRHLVISHVRGQLPHISVSNSVNVKLKGSSVSHLPLPNNNIESLVLHTPQWPAAMAPTPDFSNLSNLKYLTIQDSSWTRDNWLPQLLLSTPRLLHLDLVLYKFSSTMEFPDLNSLTHLDLMFRRSDGSSSVFEWSETDVLTFLSHFPRLLGLTIRWSANGEHYEVDMAVFLTALAKRYENNEWAACPLLESLEFRSVCLEMTDLATLAKARGQSMMTFSLAKCYRLPDVEDVTCEELLTAMDSATTINLPYVPRSSEF